MSDDEDLDLEDFWEDLRPAGMKPRGEGIIKVVSPRATDLDGVLEIASAKTTADLEDLFAQYSGLTLTHLMLAEIVATGVKTFMSHWRETLKGQDLAGLIELVLEGQSLPVEELRGFVRALPAPLLERVARSAVGTAKGTHGLMAIEHARRTGQLQEYTLGMDSGRLYAEFIHPSRQQGEPGRKVKFFLDEEFHLPEDEADTEESQQA